MNIIDWCDRRPAAQGTSAGKGAFGMMEAAMTTTSPATGEFANVYAAFSSGLRTNALPRAALNAAKTNLLDTLACAIAGSSAPGVEEVADLVRKWGGAGEASIWG